MRYFDRFISLGMLALLVALLYATAATLATSGSL